jgi:DNA replication and repair protein RecF
LYYQKAFFHQFRNLDDATIEFAQGLNIFIGQNGQGKTNFLEGLCLVTQGESFRYGDNKNFIRSNCSESSVRADIINKDLPFTLQLQLLKSKKNHLMNGKRTTSAFCAEQFPVIIFSPESLSAIKEGDDQRRQLVDSLLVTTHPEMASVLSEYRKALRSRNRVLRNHLDGSSPKNETTALLESLKPSFLLLATKLTLSRIEALRSITPELNQAMRSISHTQSVDILVDYVVSGESAGNFDEQKIFDALNKRLEELASAELASGLTLVGPHKHDIMFLYNQNDSRFFCSQGQQRALILAFKMAQIVYHRKVHKNEPVLMLDDVLSELDFEKRTALISFLKDLRTQIFISTTDLGLPTEIIGSPIKSGKDQKGDISDIGLSSMAVFKIAEGKVVETGFF